jgi:hypothetical protein
MEGFYSTTPPLSEHHDQIHLFEIMSGLSAVIYELHISVGAQEDVEKFEGLGNAAQILMSLLKARYTGERVVKAPRPRLPAGARPPTFDAPRKRKPRPAPVVSLVQPTDSAARAA